MPRRKPFAICRVHLCRLPTQSGRAEKDIEKRYCWRHSPEQLAHLKEMGKKNNARNARVDRKAPKARGGAPVTEVGFCPPPGPRCALGPSFCPYTRQSHWYWTKTARAKCETWGKLIAGLASRVPFNPWAPRWRPKSSGTR